jgi:hypothetical protein
VNPLWNYFSPLLVIGLIVGAGITLMAFRRPLQKRRVWLIGVAAALVVTSLWHGLGAAAALERKTEALTRQRLVDWEVPQMQARLHEGPLSRQILLSGPADDFQRGELVRIISDVPGVSNATWSDDGGIPLLAEGMLATLLGLMVGAIVAYLIVLRRRYNAQWRW